jgi:[ribosomal protein S5]-alanine N-acetyltransferase
MMTPEISQWLAGWPVPFTVGMAATRIVTCRRRAYAGESLPFSVVKQADGTGIGWASLDRNSGNARRGSLSFWLGEQHHGKGYMGELVPFVIAAGFERLDLNVIEAGAQTENTASLAVMRGCNMRPSGEKMVFAAARNRHEICCFHEIRRPGGCWPATPRPHV